jgi:16S rRNA (adenine1518-N6/adenine1519-N6)-dimethyltransferase
MTNLLGASEIRELAAQLDLKPTKKLGQNFVVDSNICRKIVKLAQVGKDDIALEIGPGLGSLTLALLDSAQQVVAVEIDDRLAKQLPITVENHGFKNKNLMVINQDAMQLREISIKPTVLVANLPYNISVPVLLNTLEHFPSINRGVVMVQSEVAERLAAKPNNKQYGSPTVKANWWSSLSLSGSVSRSVFWPVPNVDSSLVRFDRHPPLGSENERVATFAVIDQAFAKRRKMMRAALNQLTGTDSEKLLLDSGIDPTIRGEALSVAQFFQIGKQVIKHNSSK